jgi:hypothetical protein
MIRYRSLHPERIHYFIENKAVQSFDAAACDDPAAPSRAVSDLLQWLGAGGGPGPRAEVSLLYRYNEAVGCRRIHRDEFDTPPAIVPGDGSPAPGRGRSDGYDDLYERVMRVFDPEAIMLP